MMTQHMQTVEKKLQKLRPNQEGNESNEEMKKSNLLIKDIIVAAIDLIVAALGPEVKGTSYISVVLLQHYLHICISYKSIYMLLMD